MEIEKPPEPREFRRVQLDRYLEAARQGHPEEVCALRAGVLVGEIDMMLSQFSAVGRAQRARAEALLPLAAVRERMNAVMEAANDPDEPMAPALAIEILKRRDGAAWGDRQVLQVLPGEARLPEEERLRLQGVFGVQAVEAEFSERERPEESPK